MCTSVTVFYRQRILFHVAVLLLSRLHGSSSLPGCSKYPEVCLRETTSHNNCTVTPNNQRCHYSKNDSLQQRDLLSLFGQDDDVPLHPNNFSVNVNYFEHPVVTSCMPKLEFSWKLPSDENSAKWLIGFVLNISYFYNNKHRRKVRIFFVDNKISNDVKFKYECFLALPGVNYSATIYSLPTNLRNSVTQTVSVGCSLPYAIQQPKEWRATVEASVLSSGLISVYIMPAPTNFNFSGFRVWLATKSARCRGFNSLVTVATLCPEQGKAVLNPSELDLTKDLTVCVQPYNCGSCKATDFDIGPYVVPAEETATPNKVTDVVTVEVSNMPHGLRSVDMTTDLRAGGSLPPGALLLGAIFILALFVVLVGLILAVRRYRTGRPNHKQGLNTTKKYVFLIYSDEVRLYFIDVIYRLSAFLRLCNACEVISSESCNSVRALKSRIAHADCVLIISAADASRRERVSAERSDFSHDPKTQPVGDMFNSAIKIIKKDFQTGHTHNLKVSQIILTRCHDGSAEVDLPFHLKVKKTFQLMEFIHELWVTRPSQTSSSDSISVDFRRCCNAFEELERAAVIANCCLEQRNSCTSEMDQQSPRPQSSNDSETAADEGYVSFPADQRPSFLLGCTGDLWDTRSQMTNRNPQCESMRRNAERRDSNGSLGIERQHHETASLSSVECKLLKCNSQKEIYFPSLDDYFFLESRTSSSETISSSSFRDFTVTINKTFDGTLHADGTENDCAIGYAFINRNNVM